MGVILNGILGGLSGRVAGVVGARWKDKQYLRRYAIPANPDTALQQIQRGKMRTGVALLKALVGSVFNQYVDKFQKSMSGFNYTLQQNMQYFTPSPGFGNIKITQGKLWGVPTVSLTTGTHEITVNWTVSDLGNNGASTDKVYAVFYDTISQIWYFSSAEVARSVGQIVKNFPAGVTGHLVVVYAWASKYSLTSATLLEMISNSTYSAVTCG